MGSERYATFPTELKCRRILKVTLHALVAEFGPTFTTKIHALRIVKATDETVHAALLEHMAIARGSSRQHCNVAGHGTQGSIFRDERKMRKPTPKRHSHNLFIMPTMAALGGSRP